MRLVHGLISRGAELRQKRVNFRARGRERRRRPSQQRIHAKLSQMTRSDFSGLSGKFRELRFAQQDVFQESRRNSKRGSCARNLLVRVVLAQDNLLTACVDSASVGSFPI